MSARQGQDDASAGETTQSDRATDLDRNLIVVILRICVPALLWTIVGIAAPAFIAQIHHGDRAIQEDFAVYYYSALETRHGLNPYTTNFSHAARASGLDIHAISLSTDPPTFIAIFVPLTYLPLRTAYLLWQAINFACLAAAMLLLLGPGSGLKPSVAFTLAALFLLYPPIASHFWFGQSKFPILLLFVLMMRALKRGRHVAAGTALAFATLLHVFPIVIAGYLVLLRRWRALGWTMAALIIGAVLTVAFVGWRFCFEFIVAIPSISSTSWNLIQRDLAAPVFISRATRMLFPNIGFAAESTRRSLIVVVDGLFLAGTTLGTLVLSEHEDSDSRIFSLWVATAVALLPVAWDYDLALMLIPFAQLAMVAARGAASRRAIAMAILSYVLLFWWEYVSLSANELGFFSLLTAYLSAYWLAVDQPGAIRLPLREMPAEIWRRLIPAA